MSYRIFSTYTFMNNKMFSYKNNIMFFLLFISNFIIINNDDQISGVNAPFPTCIQLRNNNLFLANSEGMFFCNQELKPIKIHEYNSKIIVNYESILNKILITQFEEDGNIICVVENVFYFFEENGDLIKMGEFPTEIGQSHFMNLLPYKKDENNTFHFIITSIDSINKILYLYHYAVNETNYVIISNYIYTPFYFDYPNIEINNKFHTCQILDSQNKGNVLTCCFQTYENDLIVIQSFDIEHNLSEIEEYYSKLPIDNINMMTSALSEDKKKMIVFYSPNNFYGYFFSYNFDLNQISNNKPVIEVCSTAFGLFKIKYFKETKEFVLACENNSNKFTVLKLDKDFNILNPDEITKANFEIPDHFTFKSISLIYDTNETKYAIISDYTSISSDKYQTNKFLINTNFSENFLSQLEKPTDFLEQIKKEDENLKKTNKYYTYVENRNYLIMSNESKFIIDFMNEEDLLVRTKDNKTINPYLYSFYIEMPNPLEGIISIDIEGEKTIDRSSRIGNITHLIYSPKFTNKSYAESFNFFLYLKNKTLASEPGTITIYLCKQNCSCDLDLQTFVFKSCLDTFVPYNNIQNCISLNDLTSVVYDEGQKVYLDCFKMCKTCFKAGYSEHEMNCLSCFVEYGDYMEENNKCSEKKCEYLYYRDKITQMKTCINETSCPNEYPIHNNQTNQCEEAPFTILLESSSTNNPTNNYLGSQSTLITNTFISLPTESLITYKSSRSSIISTELNLTNIPLDSSENNEQSLSSSIISTELNLTNIPLESSENNEIQSSMNSEDSEDNSRQSESFKNGNELFEFIMDLIKESIGEDNIDQVNKTYSLLSNCIKNLDVNSFKEDITISGKNVIYQITTSDNQKISYEITNISTIDLGDCEKNIKKKISHENDKTPLLILKIDIKKEKTTAVEYEVYNPYTKEKIDLSICSNVPIGIYAPININQNEISLYDSLNEQGYNLYDAKNSFYIDPCATFTSSNGTDVSLSDRKNYYYNDDTALCEDVCQYVEINTKTKKVHCECNIKKNVNVESDQSFSPEKLMEQFYKIDDYTNFEVLYCYKLVFSLKGLKKNICFYIILVLFILFFVSMIINLFNTKNKIDAIILTIFKDRSKYQFLKKNGRINIKNDKNINDLFNSQNNFKNESIKKSKFCLINRLKLSQKKINESSYNDINSPYILNKSNNLYNVNNKEIIKKAKRKNKKQKKLNDSLIRISNPDINRNILELKGIKFKKKRNYSTNLTNRAKKEIIEDKLTDNNNNCINNKNNNKQEENNIEKKVSNININIINNIMNNHNPPKKCNISLFEKNLEEKLHIKEDLQKKKKRKKVKKAKKKSIMSETPNSSNSTSVVNLKKYVFKKKNKLKKSISSLNEFKRHNKLEEKKRENINIQRNNINRVKYIDEELNRMEYEEALIQDKRQYCQYYWSLLKKKHMIVLTFASNDDYNVFLLKFSLFILSIALFFSINTLFFRDSTMHQIFTEKGRYNLIYQIPQVLYSTLISFFMTLILKKLSLSQNEMLAIKREDDQMKSKKLADKSKKCLQIKLYIFFFFGIALLLFFWYYITAFAAVYTNTQIHLIKDTLLSFVITMIYPFPINLIPGIFRLNALKGGNKNKEFIFKIGQIISFI